jgi:hypothetical protein
MLQIRQTSKSRGWWAVLLIVLIILTLGLATLDRPPVSAACPIEGCNSGGPDPTPLPVQPPLRDIYFHRIDTTQDYFWIYQMYINYPTVTASGQRIYKDIVLDQVWTITPSMTSWLNAWSGDVYIKGLRVDTSRPTTFKAYGRYNTGLYGYKTALVQSLSTAIFKPCHTWFRQTTTDIGLQAYGFYPNQYCS